MSDRNEKFEKLAQVIQDHKEQKGALMPVLQEAQNIFGCVSEDVQKVIAEGAGAVSVAAAMFNKIDLQGKKAVCVLSGGNIDVTILSRVIKRGLLMSGRSCQLMIELMDKPGQLKNVSRIIADLGGNVTSVHHERANEGSDVNGCYLRIVLETRNYEHIQQIRQALTDFGFKLIN